ncbi:MAG: hypothetical protein ACD_54C00618G0003 [uncultured bacterium]|nr:MAG: hypothetical protein ACD_54C00618G0003 [uncultured bacterium]
MSVSAPRFPQLAPQEPVCQRSGLRIPQRPLPNPPLPVAELLAILICGLLLVTI